MKTMLLVLMLAVTGWSRDQLVDSVKYEPGSTYTVWWEDLWGGGDFSYRDTVLRIEVFDGYAVVEVLENNASNHLEVGVSNELFEAEVGAVRVIWFDEPPVDNEIYIYLIVNLYNWYEPMSWRNEDGIRHAIILKEENEYGAS